MGLWTGIGIVGGVFIAIGYLIAINADIRFKKALGLERYRQLTEVSLYNPMVISLFLNPFLILLCTPIALLMGFFTFIMGPNSIQQDLIQGIIDVNKGYVTQEDILVLEKFFKMEFKIYIPEA